MGVERISPETLKSWLESSNPPAVVDVRDDDRIGGHVRGSIHVPSMIFLKQVSRLKDDIQFSDRVVFYCQFSQQRGPTCAQHYLRRSVNPNSRQTVFVLDGGFSNWAGTYNGKEGLTENFRHELYA